MSKILKIAAIAGVALGADIAPAYPQALIYDNSPLIIHVPQGGAYGAVPTPDVVEDKIVDVGRTLKHRDPPKPRRKAAAKPFAPRIRTEPPPDMPDTSQALPSSEPKRTMLTAPPSIADGGPTPVRPTPRWRNADPVDLPPIENNDSASQ
jgi:hypothetical protein